MDMQSGSIVAAFLFTDVVGSTELWEAYPAEMAEGLEEHDQILRDEIDKRSGRIFSTAGDSFAAIFSSAVAAIDSAVAMQIRLKDVSVAGQRLLVRSAVHLGEAQLRDDDYFGPTVNRCARLMAVAHGGQILVSDAAVNVSVAARAPLRFKELGEHELKGLKDPERVHQVIDNRLDVDFPDLQAKQRPYRTNLPPQPPRLFGREEDRETVLQLVSNERLVTIVGPAGAGKTHLAVQVALEWAKRSGAEAWIVDLTPVDHVDQVPETLIRTLPARQDSRSTSAVAAAVGYLRNRDAMVVIDNCEHLLAAVSDVVTQLIAECPGLTLLTTSRERINVVEERVFRLEPLETSTAGTSLEGAAGNPAVQLFVDRARRADPSFDLTESNYASVASICRLLDGLPLAIELAASRVSLLDAHQLEEMLSMRFRVLATERRDAQPHHKTLSAALDWSHQLLDESDRLLFARLSVFPHTFALTAALGVCADNVLDEMGVLESLSRLVEKSLCRKAGNGRLVMLDSIRLYALERADEIGEMADFRQRHAEHFAAIVEAISERLPSNEAEALSTYEDEEENILAALRWCIDSGEVLLGRRIYGVLRPFWWSLGQPAQAATWGSQLIADEQYPSIHLARVFHTTGTVTLRTQPDVSGHFLTKAEEILRSLDDPDAGKELSRVLMSRTALLGEDPSTAEAICTEALELASRSDDKVGESIALMNLSVVAGWEGDWERSVALARDSVASARKGGQTSRLAEALEGLGSAEVDLGETDAARQHLAEALAVAEESNHVPTLLGASHGLLRLALLEQDLPGALRAARTAVEYLEFALPDLLIQLLVDIGRLLLRLRQRETAAVVMARVENLIRSIRWDPFDELKEAIDEVERDLGSFRGTGIDGLSDSESLKLRLLQVLGHGPPS